MARARSYAAGSFQASSSAPIASLRAGISSSSMNTSVAATTERAGRRGSRSPVTKLYGLIFSTVSPKKSTRTGSSSLTGKMSRMSPRRAKLPLASTLAVRTYPMRTSRAGREAKSTSSPSFNSKTGTRRGNSCMRLSISHTAMRTPACMRASAVMRRKSASLERASLYSSTSSLAQRRAGSSPAKPAISAAMRAADWALSVTYTMRPGRQEAAMRARCGSATPKTAVGVPRRTVSDRAR